MTTVADIIKRAMRKIHAIDSGETPTANEYTDGLEELNSMIRALSAKPSSLYAPNRVTKSLAAGTASFTIGAAGDVATAMPKEILSAYLRDSNDSDIPLLIRNLKEYEQILDKTTTGWPRKLFKRKGTALWTMYFDYVTDEAYTLILELYQPLATYTATTETITLPGEYEDMYVYNLAPRLAPEFGGIVSDDLRTLARGTLKNVKDANIHPVINISSKPFGGSRIGNIYTDGY